MTVAPRAKAAAIRQRRPVGVCRTRRSDQSVEICTTIDKMTSGQAIKSAGKSQATKRMARQIPVFSSQPIFSPV